MNTATWDLIKGPPGQWRFLCLLHVLFFYIKARLVESKLFLASA